MRIYRNPYELLSEVFRDLDEMGIIVKPKSYQNKNIEGDENYWTKEIQNYVYSLISIDPDDPLFFFEDTESWANAEFEERINFKAYPMNPGEAYKLRLDIWEQFLVDIGGKFPKVFDYTYNQRLHPGLSAIMKELRRNPDSRQLWLPIFQEFDLDFLGGEKRIPCSLGYYFMAREGKLNLTYIQRSADAVTHFGNDIYLAWRMMEYVAKETGLEAGILTHHIFSLHAYKKDWKTLREGIHLKFHNT